MKKLSRTPQISMQSHPEIMPRLSEIATKLQGEQVGYLTKQITYGHIINGLILLLLDNPEDGQLAMARMAIERLEDWTVDREPRSKGLETRGHPLVQLPKPKRKEQRGNGKA